MAIKQQFRVPQGLIGHAAVREDSLPIGGEIREIRTLVGVPPQPVGIGGRTVVCSLIEEVGVGSERM